MIEFESAAVTVVENAVQVEIGVRLATVGQADIVTGNLAVPIMARISTSDITAVAGGTGNFIRTMHTISGPTRLMWSLL